MTAVAIDIRGVNLSYGATHVLKGIDLSIRPGELFAFLGPSGCGKTTLLRLIAGFAQAQTGQVLLDGQDVAALPPWKRDVGMVFQSYALWPHMTVAQNVAFGLEERRKPRGEVAAKVAQALELVGLSAYAQRRPAQLSGGQQQRVALARTIAIEPKVLLLDEPLSNLDARMRVSVRRDLRELQQRLGLTTIFVTHDQEEANTICDRIAVMEAGVIRQVGTPMELYERPDNLFVASFLGSANILEAEAGRRLVFRPQHATLAPVAGATMSGPVTNREFLGATMRYAIRIGTGEVLVDVPFQSGAELRAVGETVGVALPAERMLYLPA
jgi:iron(III) transport system ATP-binding protein